MRVVAISSAEGAADLLDESRRRGYTAFVYHHADPQHLLLRDKFLYVHDDAELAEKVDLLRRDFTASSLIQT